MKHVSISVDPVFKICLYFYKYSEGPYFLKARNIIVVRDATSLCEPAHETRLTLTTQNSTKKHITQMNSSSYDFPPVSAVTGLIIEASRSVRVRASTMCLQQSSEH